MGTISLVSVILIAVVLGTNETGAIQMGCSLPEERCVPIRHCPTVFNRIHKGELSWNAKFKKHVKSKICEPEERMDQKKHICCSNNHIECRLNGGKGVCLQHEECPVLQNTTEQKLMESAEQNVCYAHDSKKYFCCTDPFCVQHKKLCEKKDVKPAANRMSSLYPSCSSDSGAVGFEVPKALCSDRSRSIKQTSIHRVCCLPPENTSQLVRHQNAAKMADLQCGTVGYLDKIQNGTYAQRGEFPWMAHLIYRRNSGLCSGTLIHPSYVLTARHCVKASLVSVRLGVHSVRETSEHVQEIRVVDISRNPTHDVALLRLAKPATLEGHFVRPICLPVYESLRLYLPANITITGWGLTEKGRPADSLMKADTQVLINETECPMDHICTGGRTHNNHCNGDSGGPYQARGTYGESLRFVQYGVISEGPAYCSNSDRPSRGVLVAYVINWILENMTL